jgi:hypothetical protein
MATRWRTAWLLLAAALLGCGGSEPTGPQTHPARGKVVWEVGGAPASGAAVSFESATDANLNGRGNAAEDGSFSLFTIVGNRKIDGVAEGTYRATVVLSGTNQNVQVIKITSPFKVEAGKPNEFTLTLPGKPPKGG